MWCVRTRILLAVGVAVVAASCSSVAPLSDDELAECTGVASSEGTIGGSATLISTLMLRLSDDAVSAEGVPDDGSEAALDVAFNEEYGISIDTFLVLRDDADAATTVEFGEPPSVGERVSDEWFVQRDVLLMLLWNERYPASATTFCNLVMDGAGETS
jgi:hypothetical protein